MKLSDSELTELAAKKQLTCNNLEDYQNLDTELSFTCKNGHNLQASFRSVRSEMFACPQCVGRNSLSILANDQQPPAKEGQRIVGLDNATENMGVSIFDGGQLVYYHCFTFHGETIDRLIQNRRFIINTIINTWKPDKIIVEDIQYQNNISTFKILAMLLGNTLTAIQENNVPYITVLSKVWRAHFMANELTRVQQKAKSIELVETMYGIKVNDDIAEAILIGKYGVDQSRISAAKKLF